MTNQVYPTSHLDDALDDLLLGGAGGGLAAPVTVAHPWQAAADHARLAPRYRVMEDDLGPGLQVDLGPHRLRLEQPVELAGVQIPKPWGQEVWFTGIEARGESQVVTPAGRLPLSHYLALAPRRLCRGAPLVLLKVLDPRPEPVLGDLYFEVHERKQEVYVVTHVDAGAWPDGTGRIRFGMNQALRQDYADDGAFRAAYLQAVRDYEQVRRGIDGGQPIPAARERALRAAMEAFTAERDLRVGDVVVVPPWLPHALQHGVRVVEFQTPTYERQIISFAQRVLTQDHWDSGAAVARMTLAPPPQPEFVALAPGVQRIVAFDDFRVWRVTLDPGGSFELPSHPSYVLCMAVAGTVRLGGLTLAPEQAAFVPGVILADPGRRHAAARAVNLGPAAAVLLVAAPDL